MHYTYLSEYSLINAFSFFPKSLLSELVMIQFS